MRCTAFLSAGTVQAEADANQELDLTEAGAVRGTATRRPIGDRAEVTCRYTRCLVSNYEPNLSEEKRRGLRVRLWEVEAWEVARVEAAR